MGVPVLHHLVWDQDWQVWRSSHRVRAHQRVWRRRPRARLGEGIKEWREETLHSLAGGMPVDRRCRATNIRAPVVCRRFPLPESLLRSMDMSSALSQAARVDRRELASHIRSSPIKETGIRRSQGGSRYRLSRPRRDEHISMRDLRVRNPAAVTPTRPAPNQSDKMTGLF